MKLDVTEVAVESLRNDFRTFLELYVSQITFALWHKPRAAVGSLLPVLGEERFTKIALRRMGGREGGRVCASECLRRMKAT